MLLQVSRAYIQHIENERAEEICKKEKNMLVVSKSILYIYYLEIICHVHNVIYSTAIVLIIFSCLMQFVPY